MFLQLYPQVAQVGKWKGNFVQRQSNQKLLLQLPHEIGFSALRIISCLSTLQQE